MASPACKLFVLVRAQDTVTARRMPEEQLLDTAAREEEAGDAMAGGHHAQPAGVEVKGVCVDASRERVVDQYNRGSYRGVLLGRCAPDTAGMRG